MSFPVRYPAFMASFRCIGEQCEDTCCKGWGMQVDEPTAQRYALEAPELQESLTGSGEACLMKRDAMTDYCVKFEDGLCGIQKRYGSAFLSDACHFYPRMHRALGNLCVMSGALSCPEVARLALSGAEEPALLTWQTGSSDRRPHSLTDYLPQGMTEEQAIAIHDAFLQEAMTRSRTPERSFMHIYCTAQSLERIPAASWADATPFYLEHAATRLPAATSAETDPFFLLQALCGLMAAAKKGQQTRLLAVVRLMEAALQVTIQWDTLAIAHLPGSAHAARSLEADWQKHWQMLYAPLLRRYLAAQLSLALFPFSGLGNTLSERMGIIGVRFATLRLALMSACRIQPALPDEADCVRMVQSLARFLDHLAGAEFSLSIYKETGWLDAARLRALVGDAV